MNTHFVIASDPDFSNNKRPETALSRMQKLPEFNKPTLRAVDCPACSRSAILQRTWPLILATVLLLSQAALAIPQPTSQNTNLWSLKPVVQPAIPRTATAPAHPIDAFVATKLQARGLKPLPPANKLTLLRRVHLDLTGLPPTPDEQTEFLNDQSAGSYERVVDQLLANEQHAVRYTRHWLDLLRYADTDEGMPASGGIHLWRDWVIRALHDDIPYDEFVRAQITGYRSSERTTISATGHRSKIEPRPDDLFALGFLARGATSRQNKNEELAFAAVETISSAFMGMTVGCAKCHDHFYDPISQADYYAMKSLFDPLVLRPIILATAQERIAHGQALADYQKRKTALEQPISDLIAPYKNKLFEDRLAMLPPEVQAVIRKPEKQRSAAEQKIADDYFPILRIDVPKIKEIMPAETVARYNELQKQLGSLKPPDDLPVFWSVEEDPKRALEPSYILTSGDPERPQTNKVVAPNFPFAPLHLDFREGRRETFADWLSAPDNPLLARVAVHRIWQWHFGTGLHAHPSDFGTLGGLPEHPELLDWLAAEFVAHNFSMKWLHRLIVTSDTYQRASRDSSGLFAANQQLDPDNHTLWRFPLKRLEAEPIWDALWSAAGSLDLSVGGKSFPAPASIKTGARQRRGIYLTRGYQSSREVMPDFLQAFDVEDGRTVCARRTQTVTAPQALLMMNSPLIESSAAQFAERLALSSSGQVESAVKLGYQIALGRPPSLQELTLLLGHLQNDPQQLKDLAWFLFNLDEFLYAR